MPPWPITCQYLNINLRDCMAVGHQGWVGELLSAADRGQTCGGVVAHRKQGHKKERAMHVEEEK